MRDIIYDIYGGGWLMCEMHIVLIKRQIRNFNKIVCSKLHLMLGKTKIKYSILHRISVFYGSIFLTVDSWRKVSCVLADIPQNPPPRGHHQYLCYNYLALFWIMIHHSHVLKHWNIWVKVLFVLYAMYLFACLTIFWPDNLLFTSI